MPLRFSTLYRKTKPPVEISLILGVGGSRQKMERKFLGFAPRELVERGRGASVIRQNSADFVRNTFELRPIHTAKIENRNWKPKWGGAAGATQTHSRQKFPNPKGFSTLRVARRLPIQFHRPAD